MYPTEHVPLSDGQARPGPVVGGKAAASEKASGGESAPGTRTIYDLMAEFKKIDGERLFAHQRYAVNHLVDNPLKSVLICYAMGTGKTGIVAEYCVRHFHGKTVYMGPKSLHSVFSYHVSNIGGDMRAPLVGAPPGILRYGVATSEAANVYDQVMREVEPVLGKVSAYDKRTARQDSRGEPVAEAPQVVVVMDECHIFSARVAKIMSLLHYSSEEAKQLEAREKQAYRLYRFLCRDPRVRVIAMTGTLIKTHPFNMVPIINIVRHEIVGADGRRSLAFPEVFGRFHDSFIRGLLATLPPTTTSDRRTASEERVMPVASLSQLTTETKKLETFATRLRNLILWYEAPKGLPDVPFPVIESEEYVELPMKAHQWQVYRNMEEEEARIEESFRRDRPDRIEGAPLLDELSVYRSFTRQASNFAFLEDMYIGKHRSAQEMLAMMPKEAFSLDNIGQYSCKIEAILKSVVKLSDRIHGIFSVFVRGAGLAAIAKCLDVMGWQSLNSLLHGGALSYSAVASSAKKGQCLYMTLTGETTPEMKTRLISVFNQPENARDNLIRVVLYSGAAAHGLTFMSGRVVHFLEPQWDDVEEAQARDRFVRINSSAFLPPSERRIRIYYYLAVHPDPDANEETTDQHLRLVSERKALLNGLFTEWVKCAAVDCGGMFQAESQLHGRMIAAGQVPPNRIFFRCVTCEAKYIQSYFLQELTNSQCSHFPAEPPPEKAAYAVVISEPDRRVILDRRNGIGWIARKDPASGKTANMVLSDAIALRNYWKKALKK